MRGLTIKKPMEGGGGELGIVVGTFALFHSRFFLVTLQKKGTSVTDNVFSFKMGGDDETTENQNFKSSSSIESSSKTYNNGTDMKRYLKNFMLFSNLEIESEKKCRDEQLSKIMKALMYMEKRLRKEQEIIQQQLCEKDKVINRQMHTISNMKVKFGVQCDDLDDDINLHETAEYCPMCRKKYYLRAMKSMATQTVSSGNKFQTNISDGEQQKNQKSLLNDRISDYNRKGFFFFLGISFN